MVTTKTDYNLLYLSTVLAAVGGFLIGYDLVIVSGALLFIKSYFNLTTVQQEMVVSALLLCATLGALIGWPLAEFFGRKKTISISAVIFTIGAILVAFSQSYAEILIGRGITGLATGIISMAIPFYTAEIVPKNIRGSCVCLEFFFFLIGVFIATLFNWIFGIAGSWRWMFAASIIPSIGLFIGTFYIPESPLWLLMKGQSEKAKEVFFRLRRPFDVQAEVDEIDQNLSKYKKVKTEFKKKGVLKVFCIGIAIALIMEFTGIAGIFYYAPTILEIAGFPSKSAAITANIYMGITVIVTSFILILIIDSIGRRKLLFLGMSLLILSLIGISLVFKYYCWCQGHRVLLVSFILLYVAAYVVGIGSIGRLLISEIFPLRIRSFAIGFCITIRWLVNYFISRYLLTFLQIFGKPLTFASFAFLSLLGLIFIYYFVPETAGKSLEKIEEYWLEEGEHATVI